MKYYAVIDTNVLVSAMLKWDSVPGNIMELVFTGCIVPVVNVLLRSEKTEDAYLVTGNLNHFPKKTFIVTPREMFDMILTDAA